MAKYTINRCHYYDLYECKNKFLAFETPLAEG